VLVDFEHGTVYSEQKPGESVVSDSLHPDASLLITPQGTPVFLACAAMKGGPICLGLVRCIAPGMPDLTEAARPLYEAIWPTRLEQFPPRPDDIFPPRPDNICILKETKEAADREWFHELRRDAESVFWLLLWWAIHVRPAESNEADAPIRYLFWAILVEPTNDVRETLLFTLMEGNWLHPAYAALGDLLKSMASYLRADLHWITKENKENKNFKEMKDPEFMHEAFQRLIFDFLVGHKEELFMHQRRAATNRVVEKVTWRTTGF
jgi:hypothetical protein